MNVHKPKILLINREPWWSSFFEEVLSKRGYQVEVEHDEAKGLTRLDRDGYDIVVLDFTAGEEELGVLKSIMQKHPHEQVIVVSATPSWQEARAAYRLGAIDYLNKSFDKAKLIEVVETVLKKEAASVASG